MQQLAAEEFDDQDLLCDHRASPTCNKRDQTHLFQSRIAQIKSVLKY